MVTVFEDDQCGYAHDISDEERDVDIFEYMDAEEWSCHHPSADGSEYCLFHQPVEQKDDEVVVERFLEVVNTGYDDVDLPPQERLRFIGAEFGDFSLPLFTTLATSGQFDPAAAEHPLDLRDVRVEGALHWSQTTVRHSLLFDGAFVGGDVDFSETTIEGGCSFVDGQFASVVRIDDVEIADALSFDNAELELAVTMAASTIGREVTFENCHVHAPAGGNERLESDAFDAGDIWSPDSRIGDSLTIRRATIDGSIWFAESDIGGSVNTGAVDIGESAAFDGVGIEGSARFIDADIGESARFDGTSIGDAAEFDSVTVQQSARFENTTIGLSAEFRDADIGGAAKFAGADIGESAAFKGASIGSENTETGLKKKVVGADTGGSAEFTGAHIGESAKFDGVSIAESAEFSDVDIGKSAEFSDASLGGTAKFEGADIGKSAGFSDASVGGSAEFGDASIARAANFSDASVGGVAEFEGADIEKYARFERAEIGESAKFKGAAIGRVEFDGVDIGGSAYFGGTDIQMRVEFEDATIEEAARFNKADLGWAVFDGADIGESAEFWDADIGNWAGFEGADIGESADFGETTIGESAEFGDASIGESATFDGATIGALARFEGADIGDSVEFEGADIGGKATFRDASIGGKATFRDANIGGSVIFTDATPETVFLDDATFSSDATLSGHFGDRPSMTGLSVEGTLSLDLTHETAGWSVVEISDSTIESLAVSDGARPVVLDLAGTSIARFDEQDLPDSDILYRWSLPEMDFTRFDFTESREVLTDINWDFHSLDGAPREALAQEAVRGRAAEQATALRNLLVGAPALSHRLVDGDTAARDGNALVTDAAEIVFTDDAHVSGIVDNDLADVTESDDPAIRESFLDDEWVYTLQTARAIRKVHTALETDPDFADALASDAVASNLETIAARVVEADPDVGRDVDESPEEQVDVDTVSTVDLETVLRERYADPDDFRARDNPEVWERTYLDAKTAASDQGLNEVAAEFFVREKRFKRKRHAQRVHDCNSMFERAKGAFDWVSNLTMDVTTGYGERPRNVVVSSLATVGLFTGIYWALDALDSGSGALEYLLFSFQGFIQFILGASPQGSVPVRLATAIEGFLGAFLIALFVFTLTRSLNR